MIIEMDNIPEITAYGDYKVTIKVKDIFGNTNSQECNIKIEWIKSEYYLELGDTLTKEDLLYNVEIDGDKLPQEEIDAINSYSIGEYELKVVNEEKECIV